MSEHPGYFWICFWLALLVISQPSGNYGTLSRIADSLQNIERQIGAKQP